MAIQHRIVNSSLTEIYTGGGGNFMTENYPTNFHNRYRKKILVGAESIDNFKEITPAEWDAIEAEDAGWNEPDKGFILQAQASGMDYNPATGYFELNGLTDITNQEALVIHDTPVLYDKDYNKTYLGTRKLRTNICAVTTNDYLDYDISYFASGQDKLEVARITLNPKGIRVVHNNSAFNNCAKLRKILGIIVDNTINDGYGWLNTFRGCYKLEDIRIKGLRLSLSFKDSPLLSLESIQYTVANAANTSPITIILHPEAYARVTDEILALAAEKQITIATT